MNGLLRHIDDSGHTEMVRLLLESKADVNDTNTEGHTLLHIALVSVLILIQCYDFVCTHFCTNAHLPGKTYACTYQFQHQFQCRNTLSRCTFAQMHI